MYQIDAQPPGVYQKSFQLDIIWIQPKLIWKGRLKLGLFKSQQAAELGVKELLSGLEMIAHDHAISKLLGKLSFQGIQVSSEIMDSANLDKHYLPIRYPISGLGSSAWIPTRMLKLGSLVLTAP